MLTLTGTLRQFGDITIGEEKKSFLKLWIEHETPRQDGPADLKIEELLIPKSEIGPEAEKLKSGSPVSVVVRAYARGRDIAFSAVRQVDQAAHSSSVSAAK